MRLRDEYRGRLDVAVGIEYGWLAAADQLYIEINKQYETDIVINSVHLVSGEDCYFAPFFDKRTRREAYTPNTFKTCPQAWTRRTITTSSDTSAM